jgi:hypothetical protein
MPRRFRMISCEVSQREVYAAAARARHLIDVDFLPKGLHDVGPQRMAAFLQEAVDSRPPDPYEAILLWYGLCNNGVCGVRAPLPMVVPRAHDCIALLLGSRRRYEAFFRVNPGTFYKSPGWIERDTDPNDNPASVTARLRLSHDRRELAEQYGEDQAEFLTPLIADWFKHYRKLAFINTGVGDVDAYREQAGRFAAQKGWAFEELEGNLGLLERLVNGEWDPADFLIVPPGKTIRPSFGSDIIACE